MSTEIATVENAPRNIAEGYSSIRGGDLETRKLIYSAVTNAAPLAENLGKEIALSNIIIQPVESISEESGELERYSRVILIDAAGTAYAASSDGVLTSVNTLLTVFGEPSTWEVPLPVKVVEKKGKRFKFFTIELV